MEVPSLMSQLVPLSHMWLAFERLCQVEEIFFQDERFWGYFLLRVMAKDKCSLSEKPKFFSQARLDSKGDFF